MTEKPSIRIGGTNRLDLAAEGSEALVQATGKAPAASPEKWDESQIEEYIPTLYDPIITAAHNDNDGKGVYYVARWKAVANGLAGDGETRKDAVRALLDATSDWLGVFVATERRPAAASPEPVVCLSFPEDDIALIRGVPNSDDYWDNHDFCRIADMMEKYDLVPKDCGPLYAEPTPNSEAEEDLPTMTSLWGASPDHPGVSDDAAETRALLEALEPFAKVADLISDDNIGDDTGLWARSSNMPGESYTLTVGHARRARTAIDQAKSPTEEVGYGVKHLEPLRCQEYEDEIRVLREALEEALPFVAVATSHPAITHPEGIENAEAALLRVRTALAKEGL